MEIELTGELVNGRGASPVSIDPRNLRRISLQNCGWRGRSVGRNRGLPARATMRNGKEEVVVFVSKYDENANTHRVT